MKRCVVGTVVCFLVAPIQAAESTFDFKDPKGINAVTFLLDSVLEPIAGWAAGVSGAVRFDPDAPEKMSGAIAVDTNSITVGLPMMTEHLRSADWLDTAKFPTIEFKIKRVVGVQSKENQAFDLMVVGDFSCHGVTKEMTVAVQARYLPGKFRSRYRSPGAKGDLLILRSDFTIQRSDFNIKPGAMKDMVAEDIQVRLSIIGGNVDPSQDKKP